MKKSIYLVSFLLSGCFNTAMFLTSNPNIQAFGLDKDGVCYPYFDKETNRCNLDTSSCPPVTSSKHLEELARLKQKFCGENGIKIDAFDSSEKNQENMCKKIENIIKCPDGYTNTDSDGIIFEFKRWEQAKP